MSRAVEVSSASRGRGPGTVAALATQLAAAVRVRARPARPFCVAIDGRSGAGKSTLAAAVAPWLDALVIDGDDFYAGGAGLRPEAPQELAALCIDWRRQRQVLQTLREGRAAAWHAFDWEAFDGRLCAQATQAGPAPVVVLEGTYAARPELQGVIDLRVLLDLPADLCRQRLLAREGAIGPWEAQWHAAEDWYFAHLAPASGFGLVLR